MIKDKKKNQSQFVNLEFMSIWSQQMRMEASATLGVSAASLVINADKFELLLPRQSKYYFGRATSAALKPALRIELEPHIMIDFLFDKSPRGKNWLCEKDSLARPVSCENKTTEQQVQYDRENPKKRKITLVSSQYELQLVFQSDMTKVELADNWLDVDVPESYQRIELK